MGQMLHKTRHQMNSWRWDNPHAFGDKVEGSDLDTTSSEKVKHTGDCVSC